MSERYQIRSKIGTGGIGAVYRAFDTGLKREVAIKRLLNQEHKPEEARKTAEYLINEAGLLSKLQHPNIVSVFDVSVDDEGAFIVMEYIHGETLSETVKRGALTLKDFVRVVEQSLEALVCAQDAGMLHRDIKPTNVMIRWLPSGSFQLKILDFGLGKISERPTLQTIDHGNSILGSIYFMSPEQLEREPLDQRTDLYSLGCLLYYALAGAFPFKGKAAPEVMVAHLEHDVVPIHRIRPDIPAAVCDFVMKLISLDRNERPASASDALSMFERITAPLSSSAYQPNPASPPIQRPPSAGVSPYHAAAPRRLITDTASQSVPLLSTTNYFRPPLRKNGKTSWIAPVVSVAAILSLALWFVFRNASDARSADAEPATAADFPAPASPPARDPDVLIPFGSEWNYLEPGKPAPGNWITLGFDDSGWQQGKSPIGYGDELATDIGNDSTKTPPRPVSLFFRREFQSSREDLGERMDLRVRADDGVVVFINGFEALRMGLPGGEIDNETLAVRLTHLEDETVIRRFALERTQLRHGRNVIAVRVHQHDPLSSDCHFDLELRSRGGARTPEPEPEPDPGYAEVAATAATSAPQWSFRFTRPSGNWDKQGYVEHPGNWQNGLPVFVSKMRNGISPDIAKTVGSEWSGNDIWLRRKFDLSDADLATADRLAFKILHDDDITVFLNGVLAFERSGHCDSYGIFEITVRARQSLVAGQNILAVHCLNADGPAMVDVGIIRRDAP